MTPAEISLAIANKEKYPHQFEKIKETLIEDKIRKRYSINQEFAILRQRDSKSYEFQEYNSYVELCKYQVKKELGIL